MEKTINAMGIDLTEEYVQISYRSDGESHPISLSISPDEKKYLIPSKLYYREENDSWYAGEEAVFNSESDKKPCLGFDAHIKYNTGYMSKFLELLIKMTERITGMSCTGAICVSEEDCDLKSIQCIYGAFAGLGYDENKIRVINHDEAFIYYTINQKKDLWVNDVALFDFTKKTLKYRRLHEIKGKNLPVITVSQEDLTHEISYDLLSSESGRHMADMTMLGFIQKEFKKNIVCTTFLTGAGFYEEWAETSVQELCSRRRVFKGYNLFVKGACFAACKKYEEDTGTEVEKKHLFQCTGRTKAEIGLCISHEGKERVIVLSSAGTNWYEAGAEAECIPDDITKIDFVIMSAIHEKSVNYALDISEFPSRPNKTTRVRITLGYKNDDTFDIIIEDLGFGELFKASGKTVKETVSVSGLFNP